VQQRLDGDERGHRCILVAAHTTYNAGQWHMTRACASAPPQEFIEVAFYAAARNARLEVMRTLRHEGISVQGISNALCEAAAESQLEAVQELLRMATL